MKLIFSILFICFFFNTKAENININQVIENLYNNRNSITSYIKNSSLFTEEFRRNYLSKHNIYLTKSSFVFLYKIKLEEINQYYFKYDTIKITNLTNKNSIDSLIKIFIYNEISEIMVSFFLIKQKEIWKINDFYNFEINPDENSITFEQILFFWNHFLFNNFYKLR